MKHFEVIVIGGGHAGVEAAAAAARVGAKVCLITHHFDTIGTLSCNPAIGGLGKGHLVREIDALGGLMARVADRSGIQFRVLNRSKGPAVRGLRAQMDRRLYLAAMQTEIKNTPRLTIIESAVGGINLQNGAACGIILEDDSHITCDAVVLTTGTFLGGVIHRGETRIPAGRLGDKPSNALAQMLRGLDLPIARLKTGTPARIDGRSINWSILEDQPADDTPVPFSFLTDKIHVPQIACGITWTNTASHEIIAQDIEKSAVYSGAIEGIGPRYCPSIEDKVHKFPDRDRHQIFLEPEDLSGRVIYPNGISSSLPRETQERFIRKIPGLESCAIIEYGYAIEYDFIQPTALKPSLELKSMPNLFLAGQINGTTGYEEAAAQGLLAGMNAARLSQNKDAAHFDRSDAYIGVMIDDLVTKGVSEPYRMFTSRAEYRLSLRADNADQRLTELGHNYGCVDKTRLIKFQRKSQTLQAVKDAFTSKTLSPAQAKTKGWAVNQDGKIRNASAFLRFNGITLEDILAVWPELQHFPKWALEQHEIDAQYCGYLERQSTSIKNLKKQNAKLIPDDFNYAGVSGLSNELISKLSTIRPTNLSQAARIEGMTPSALILLSAILRRTEKASA